MEGDINRQSGTKLALYQAHRVGDVFDKDELCPQIHRLCTRYGDAMYPIAKAYCDG